MSTLQVDEQRTVMRLQSIFPDVMDMPDGKGGRVQIHSGEIFEADEATARRLIAGYQAIEIVDENDGGPKMVICYIGFGTERWIPAIRRFLPYGERSEVPLWLGRFLLSQEPGNFKEA